MLERAKAFAANNKPRVAGVGLILVGIASLAGFVELDAQQLTAAVGVLTGAAALAIHGAVKRAGDAVGDKVSAEGGLLATLGRTLGEALSAPSSPADAPKPEEPKKEAP